MDDQREDRDLARLREENESLRAQLEDSQGTLRAIREGSVDALVVDTPEGQRVFTLQGGEHPYRAVIEQMREGAATLTPQGVIHYCNQRFAEMLALPLERVMGVRMEDFVAAADRAALAAMLGEGAGRAELVLTAGDATEVPALVSAISLRAEGPAAICLVVTDLTERKQHEAEVQQLNERLEARVIERTGQLAGANRELEAGIVERERILESLRESEQRLALAVVAAEAASVAKSQFLANMSHELRTPLNAILGMIDVALPRVIDPTIQDYLQTARGSADLLLSLLNNLLDSAKIESGKLELESIPFSLRRMLDRTARILSVQASEKALPFSCPLPDQIPDALIGDPMRLEQVLLNLAGNAIKFTERGSVEVSLRPLSQEGEAFLEFAVRDTGIGISPSALAQLFRPFAQADASMARRFGGTGLGLSICKGLVEMMGGTIWAESEVGKGSTFYFTVRLPLAKELPSDFDAHVAALAPAGAPLRVLLVEDNPANQKLATYILRERGHSVEVAGDGQVAISLTEKNPYDVILMDVRMPGMDGLETTAAIRNRETGGRRVPIIAMTAHAMKGDREWCLAGGMDGYISKPIDVQEMIGLVENLASAAPQAARVPGTRPGPAETSPQETTLIFDAEEAIKRCFRSPDIAGKMIQFFFDDMDNLLPQMHSALDRGDLMEVGLLGHRLKGTVFYLGAPQAEKATMRVERFCTSSGGTPSEAEEAVHALEQECMVLKAALSKSLLVTEPTQDH